MTGATSRSAGVDGYVGFVGFAARRTVGFDALADPVTGHRDRGHQEVPDVYEQGVPRPSRRPVAAGAGQAPGDQEGHA